MDPEGENRLLGYVIRDPIFGIDIDTAEDLALAEEILRLRTKEHVHHESDPRRLVG
jgi:hypothetical protein